MTPHPTYIPWPGEQCLPQPGIIQGAYFNLFALRADPCALQMLCDRYFNGPSQGQVTYQPLTDHVLIAFTRIEQLTSASPCTGTIAYHDIALWVPAVSVVQQAGIPVAKRVVFFTPYIFVDSPPTMVTGRETFGLPKQMGRFTMPDASQEPVHFTADVLAPGGPMGDGHVDWRRLWDIERLPQSTTGPHTRSPWRDTWDNVARLLKAKIRPLVPSPDLFQNMLSQGYVLGLKQFRDAAAPEQAAYQAIVETPVALTKYRGGGMLPGVYQLTLNDVPTHPVAQDLGLDSGTHDITASFWMHADLEMGNGREVWNAQTTTASFPAKGMRLPAKPKKKIAILGGGMSALTAAYELSQPGIGENHEITVYQTGWRLGGKGASGRNRDMHNRIEEHGLHVWYGFYENAFRLIQRCYSDLDRPADRPLATWQDAFTKQNFAVLHERHNGEWVKWPIKYRSNQLTPGQGRLAPNFWEGTSMLLGWTIGTLEGLVRSKKITLNRAETDSFLNSRDWDEHDVVSRTASGLEKLLQVPIWIVFKFIAQIAKAMDKHALALGGDPNHRTLVTLLNRFRDWLWPKVKDRLDIDEVRLYWMTLDQMISIITGVITDDLVNKGLRSIDHLDYRDWLRQHGAKPWPTLAEASTVRFIYNAAFAFEDGDVNKPNFAAGPALRGVLRLFCTHKGAVLYKMNGGMGDVVFAPMYEILKQRGVKFEFFHHVDNLALSPDQTSVSAIEMTQQVQLKDDRYEPLFDVKGLPCWPNEPLYEQIADGDDLQALLQAHGTNLEHVGAPPAPWPHAKKRVLRHGVDYDDVVFGISLGSIPKVCGELIAANTRWRDMITHLKTVGTQAYQYWFKPNLYEL